MSNFKHVGSFYILYTLPISVFILDINKFLFSYFWSHRKSVQVNIKTISLLHVYSGHASSEHVLQLRSIHIQYKDISHLHVYSRHTSSELLCKIQGSRNLFVFREISWKTNKTGSGLYSASTSFLNPSSTLVIIIIIITGSETTPSLEQPNRLWNADSDQPNIPDPHGTKSTNTIPIKPQVVLID